MKLKKLLESPRRWPFSDHPSFGHKLAEFTFVSLVGATCKFWLKVLSTTRTQNLDTFSDLVLKKKYRDRPLITVANHYCCIDDPVIFGLLPFRLLTQIKNVRWTPGADELMFYSDSSATLFSLTRTLPAVRGWGVQQRCMDASLKKLNEGSWIHLFAEGKINMDHRRMRLKWGIARLLLEADVTPIVLPMWHHGMDDLLPNKRPYIPRMGKQISLVVGEPLDLSQEVSQLRKSNLTRVETRKQICDLITKELRVVRTQCENFHSTCFPNAQI